VLLEAEAAIGESSKEDCKYCRSLLQGANPKLKFDWEKPKRAAKMGLFHAEGHNRLGLVALHQAEPKEAVQHFRETVRAGRTYFSSRIFWNQKTFSPEGQSPSFLELVLLQPT
jgi:hypothetical protein